MATTYTRRINLYINGKEVTNDIISIRREMTKLVNEQARMTRGSKDYVKHGSEIKKLKNIINEHNNSLATAAKKPSFFQRAADGFNRFQSIAVAAIATITGIAMVVKTTIQAFAEWDEKMVDAMKTTRMSREEAEELNSSLKKIDTRTAQNDLLNLAWVAGKLGISGKENVLEFVTAANQIGVALSRDLGGTENAIRDIGKLTDIFHTKDMYGQEQAILKMGSAINELGMASTAAEGYLVNFAKRTAGIAPQAGVSVENILGLAATLDALGQRAEMSSTAYSKLMVTMTKRTQEFASVAQMSLEDFTALFNVDANEAMVRVFEGMNQDASGFQKMVDILGDLEIEGQRMTSVFGALAKNTGMLSKQQELSNKAYEEGISVTREYNLKNDTAQAKLEKYRKGFVNLQVELGKKMMPIYGQVIHKASTLLKVFGATVEFISKYGKQIAVLLITITAYSIATKLATFWQTKYSEATILSVISQKLQALAFRAQFAAISLYNAAVALFAGKTKVAAIQFRAFSAALMANPIGIVVGAIAAISAALYFYSSRLTEAQKLQKTLNDVNLTAEKQIVEQRLELEQLLRVAENENNSKERRLAAIKKINELSPEFLKGITLETLKTEASKAALDGYINSLHQKAKLMAAQEKIVEIEKEILDLQDGELGFWQKAGSAGIAYALGLRTAGAASKDAAEIEKFRAEKVAELTLEQEKLLEVTDKIIKSQSQSEQIDFDPDSPQAMLKAKQDELDLARKMPAATNEEIEARKNNIASIILEIKALEKLANTHVSNTDLIKEKEEELESARLMPGATKAEITARNKAIETIERQIAAYKELGTAEHGDSGKKESDEAIKKNIEVIEAANSAEKAAINKRHLDGISSEKQYNDELLLQELNFIAAKIKTYKVGSKEYQEEVNKAMELQLDVDLKLRELQLKAQDELAAAKIENFRDEFLRQEEAEKERWFLEKTELEKRLSNKAELNEKEQAINDAIHELIEEKEKTHQQKMTDLKTGKKLAELEDMVTATDPFDEEFAPLEQMQKSFNARAELIQAQYLNELDMAAGNHAALLAAEKIYNDAMLQLKLDMIDAEWMQREQRIEAAQSFVGALSGIVDQETALGKALFLFNQGLAIAEIWMSVAKANAKAVESSPMTFGLPWVAVNTGIGVAQTAMVLAQTVKAFTKPAKEASYSDGGPTGPGGKNEPAGIVHKGEYILSQDMLADPNVKYLTQIFEKMRTRKVSLSQAAMPHLSSGGFSSTNKNPSPSVLALPDNSKSLQQQNETNLELVKAIKLFLEYRPVVAVETIEREREKYIRIKQTSGL